MEKYTSERSYLTTGEALRMLAPYYANIYEMKLAVNARWTQYERRLSWATCALILCAELENDVVRYDVLNLHALSKGVTL